MGKTVFFGGTFNPPHLAHRLMLEAAAKCKNIDKILVVPTNIPPHKEISGFCASGEDRLNMCQLLCKGIDICEVSDMELLRGGKSYSYDTLCILKEQYNDLQLLIGGDMITTFDTWFNYKEILKIAEILAVRRPGIDNEAFDNSVDFMRNLGGIVKVIDAEMLDISSTIIRECLENGEFSKLIDYLPNNIYEYIRENNLYR